MSRFTSPRHVRDVRFPTSRDLRRLGRDEPRARLLGRLRRPRAPTPTTAWRATASPSRSAAATRCRPPRSARSRRCVVGRRVEDVLDDLGDFSAGSSSATRSCAGSARRRASCTWRSARWSTPLWDLRRQARRQAAVEAARRPRPRRRSSTLVDFRYLERRADAATRRCGCCSAAEPGRAEREATPAAARATRPTRRRPGWLGYDDEKLARLAAEAVADGLRA